MKNRIMLVIMIASLGCSKAPPQAQETIIDAEKFYRDGTEFMDTDPDKAIELLTKSLNLNPDVPPALYNRAATFSRVGRDEEAIADMNRLLAVAPEIGKKLRLQFLAAAGGFASLAEEEYKKGNYTKAIKKCESALIYDPKSGDVWVIKALAVWKLGDLEKALEYFDKGDEVEPNNFFVYINRAELHRDTKRLQDALKDYSKAIELRPTDPEAYAGRAVVYFGLNFPDKAKADEAKAKELKQSR